MIFSKKTNKKGFTLIELLVVLTVIGILATLIVANFSSSRSRARDARRKSELQQLKTALRLYYNDFQRYPTSNSGEIMGCGSGGAWRCAWGSEFLGREEYMKRIPLDPLNTGTYTYDYEQTDSGQGFRIEATLENPADVDLADSQARCGGASGQTYVVCED